MERHSPVDGHELNCKEFVELVTDYLEGKLGVEDTARFEAHLAVCDGCDIYLEQMKQTKQLLGRLSEEQVQGDARAKLLRAFSDWKSRLPPGAKT
jgi:anti-sigma factor RsiW